MERVTQTLCVACIACLAFLAGEAHAMQSPHRGQKSVEQAAPATEAAPAPAPAATPEKSTEAEKSVNALDRRYRFSKKYQSEFNITGGDYLGDEWYNTWDIGARYFFHLNNTFAVGAEYLYSPMRIDSSGDFGQNLSTKQTHIVNGQLMISNDTAFRSGKTIVECDLFFTVGGGTIQINRGWEYLIEIGGGIKIYLPVPWFAIRFDVESYLHPTPKPTGNSFNGDLALNAGLAFIFPVQRIEKKDVETADLTDATAGN